MISNTTKNISKIYKIWIKKCKIKCDLNLLSTQKEWNIGNNFSMKSEMFFIDYFRVVKVKLAQNSQVFSRYETLAALSYQIKDAISYRFQISSPISIPAEAAKWQCWACANLLLHHNSESVIKQNKKIGTQ